MKAQVIFGLSIVVAAIGVSAFYWYFEIYKKK